MPYATMIYDKTLKEGEGEWLLPTIFSPGGLKELLIADGTNQIDCKIDEETTFTVDREIKLIFHSGLHWIVFFSRSVTVHCTDGGQGGTFGLQVVDTADTSQLPLIVRVGSLVPPADEGEDPAAFAADYEEMLRRHAGVYPGEAACFAFAVDSSKRQASIDFEWDAKKMDENSGEDTQLVMFALPHHQDLLDNVERFCTKALLGVVCLVMGNSWALVEDLPQVSFRAPRPPDPTFLPVLAEALKKDITYKIPENFMRGAGDTYFSGKMLARLARIILITEELVELCASERRATRSLAATGQNRDAYLEACANVSMPTETEISTAIEHLRSAVEIWLNGNAQSPFVYDSAWGGLVNCGCYYQDGHCTNTAPADCPAFSDQGLNFGSGTFLRASECISICVMS
jgi:hypothetical protein